MHQFALNEIEYDTLQYKLTPPGSDHTLSSATIADWLSYCREVCTHWLDSRYEDEELLGGEGVCVEIDEAKFGKRNYNRGRWKDGHWVLGMIEIRTGPEGKKRRGGRYRLEICPDNKRDAATLLPLIKKHVLAGTTIITDEWKAYSQLEAEGYFHFTVNHSRNFVDPHTGANTQTIESSWRVTKNHFKTGGIRSNVFAEHLCEHLYRREVFHIDRKAKFEHFVQATRELYPGL